MTWTEEKISKLSDPRLLDLFRRFQSTVRAYNVGHQELCLIKQEMDRRGNIHTAANDIKVFPDDLHTKSNKELKILKKEVSKALNNNQKGKVLREYLNFLKSILKGKSC